MFEGVVTTLVNTFLSKYVDGLDSQQLGLHLLGGELRLENVRIKGEALDDLHLPVEVDFGFIGLLHVQWDWRQLMSKPLLVEVRDVMLVLREKSVDEAQHELDATGAKSPVDAEKKHTQLQKQKDAKLQSAEEFRLQAVAHKESAPGFMSRLINAVIDNIQVHVRNIHIRYEHRPAAGAAAGPLRNGCSLGLVLSELTLSSTDENWETKFVEGGEATHKLVDLSNLFIYCNTRESAQAQRATPDSLRNIFQHLVPPPSPPQSTPSSVADGGDVGSVSGSPALSPVAQLPPDPLCEYLLHPVNAIVRAVVHYKQGANRPPSQPLVALQVLVPLVELSVSQRQMHALLRVVSNLAGVQKRLAVFSGAYHESLDRAGSVEERERYISLYKRTLSYSWEATLSTSEGEEMAQIERDVVFQDIDDWRVCAMAELLAEQPDEDAAVDDQGNPCQLSKRQKHTTGLLAGVNNAVESVKHAVSDGAAKAKSGAKAAGSMLATTILPGVLTDKLGLTTSEQREEEAARNEELRRDDEETKEEAAEEEELAAQMDAQAAREPTIHLTDEQRQTVRAEALSSSQILFLPTGGKSRDCVNATIDLMLTSLLVRLVDDDDASNDAVAASSSLIDRPMVAPRDLFRVCVSRIGVKVVQRIDSMLAQVDVADLVVEDLATPDTLYRNIVAVDRAQRKSAAGIVRDGTTVSDASLSALPASSASSFVALVFEQNPLDESADSKISLHMQSLEVVVHPAWLERLVLFVTLPKEIDMSPLTNRAPLMQKMIQVTSSETERTLSEHKSLLLDVRIEGPSIAVVSDPRDQTRTPVLVVQLEHVGVRSRVQDKKAMQLLQDLLNQYTAKIAAAGPDEAVPSLEQLIGQEKEDVDNFYDSMLVSLIGVSASVWPCYATHKQVWSGATQHTPLLLPFDIRDLQIDQSVASNLTFLPAQRISGALPDIRLEVSVHLLEQLLMPAFMQPWKQLGKNLAAHERAATAAALRRGSITKRQMEFEEADKDGGAKPSKPASLSKPPSNPTDAANKRALELQVELHEAIAVADANPPAGPALSTQHAQEAAGFDFGVQDSLHPSENAWGSNDRELTLKDLIIALQSEKLARRVLAESGAYTRGERAEKAASSERISLKQFQDWYEHRKQMLQHNITMQLNVSVQGLHVAIVDDSPLQPQQQQQASLLQAQSSVGGASFGSVAAPAIMGRRHTTMLEVSVSGVGLFMRQRAFDKVVGVEVGALAVREGGLETLPLDRHPAAPLLQTSPIKSLPESLTRGRSIGAISGSGALPFVFLTLTALSPESPDYASRPINNDLAVSLGELELNVDPESLDRIACFMLQTMAPFALRQRLSAEAKADAAEKEALEKSQPTATSSSTSSDAKSDEHVPAVSERKLVVVRRNIDSLPEGPESVVAMQVALEMGGVTVNLNSRARSFAALSVVSISARISQRINSMAVDASVAELWLLDATENVADRERAIIWVAQSLASTSYSSKVREGSPPPLVRLHFEQHDVANKIATGFQMALDAQVLGLRARVAPVFALHMLDLLQVAKGLRVLKVVEEEKEAQSQAEEKEAEEKEKKEAEEKAANADAPKPPLSRVQKLRRRRPAKLKQQQVNWHWSADTPAPIQMNVLIDDIEIELPLQSIEQALAMQQRSSSASGVAKATVLGQEPSDATVDEARAIQAAAEAKQSTHAEEQASKRAAMGHSLVVRLERVRLHNRLRDADKSSHSTPHDTVRYEHMEASLGALRVLTSHAPLAGSAFFPLVTLQRVQVGVNKFSRGRLYEARADLGYLDVSLPHNQYVFLMRLVDTMSDLATSMAAVSSSVADEQKASEAHIAAEASAPKQMLVRTSDGSIESKEEHEARRYVHEQQQERQQDELEEEVNDEDEAQDDDEPIDALRSLPSIKASLTLQRLSIELLRDDGLDPQRDSLLVVMLKQLLLNASLDQATGEVSGGVELRVFHITDTSADNLVPNQKALVPAYRHILNFGVALADDEWVRQYHQDTGADVQRDADGRVIERPEDKSREQVEASKGIKLPSANSDASDASASSSSTTGAGSSASTMAPPLVLRVRRLGYGTSHAFEIDAELNNLQLLVAPALLALPAFFELPSDLVEKQKKQKAAQAKQALEEKERTAKRVAALQTRMQESVGAAPVEQTLPIGVLASDAEKAAMAPSSDPMLMADALLLGTASVSDHAIAADASKTPPIYARFRMNQPVVLLVADPFSRDTRGLVVSWSVDAAANIGVTPGSLQAQAALNNLSIIESSFVVADEAGRLLVFSQTAEPGQRPILPHFHLQVNAQSHLSTLFADGVSTSLAIDAHLSRLDLNVGFRLYQLVTTALDNLQPPLERAKKQQQEAEEKRAEERKSAAEVRADIVTRIDDERNKVSDGPVPQDPLGPMVAGMPVPALDFNEVNASLRAVGIYINVINDAWETNLPSLRVQADGLTVKAHRFGDGGGVWGHLDLRAEAFNHRMLAWEPIIEPWSADFALHQCQLTHTPGSSLLMASNQQLMRNEQQVGLDALPAPPATSLASPLAPITSISFTSRVPLNLNVSAALLEDLADTMNDLQKSLRSKVQAWKRTTTVPPYRIVNHTDLPFDVYRADLNQIDLLHGKGASADAPEEQLNEVMRVPPLSSAHLDFDDTVATTVRAVRIQLQSSMGALPCLIIPVARETSSKHSLQSGEGALVVVIDVEWSSGVRVISVHSSMAVTNQTNVPMVVAADRFQEKELLPGERMWLPLIVAPQMHTVRVRPSSLEARRRFQRRTMREEAAGAKETQELVSSVMGEFGWSDEIVLAAPLKNTKQRSTLVDHFSCPPDQAATALSEHNTRSELLMERQVSVRSGGSVDRHSSSLPSQGSAFHFTLFAAGFDVKDEKETESVGSSNVKRAPRAQDYHATTFYIRNPITLENVLASECQFRLLNGDKLSADGKEDSGALDSARIVEELTLARGKSCPLYGASTAKDTYLSLLIPTLAAGWSKPLKLRLSDPESSVLLAHLVGDNGGTLHVCIELKQVQGNLRVVAYTQMWMWDLSSANLQVSADKKSLLPQRTKRRASVDATGAVKNQAAHLESVSLPDKHSAVMFSYDNVKSSKGRLWVRAGRHPRSTGFELAGPCTDNASDPSITWSEWSTKLSLDAPGNQSAISMRMGSGHSAGSYEVVADVQAGEGIFRRTRMVKFLPRYVLVNMLHTPIQVRQFGMDESNKLTMAPSQQILWHWPQALVKDRTWLTVRRELDGQAAADAGGATADWHWSGYFSVDTNGDSHVRVRHRSEAARVWNLRVEVRHRDGMSFILVDEHPADDFTRLKLVLPYCIANRSSTHVLRVRQSIDADKQWEDSSHLTKPGADVRDEEKGFAWTIVPPNSEMPYSYEEPLMDSPKVQVQVARVNEAGNVVGEWVGGDRALQQLELDSFDEDHAFIDLERSAGTGDSGSSSGGVARASNLISSATSSLASTLRRDSASGNQRLYYYSQQDGPTHFIVFSDQPSDAWKRKQLRERTEAKNREKESGIKRGADDSAVRKSSTRLDEEEKTHVATAGDKERQIHGRGAADDSTAKIAMQTAEQQGLATVGSEVKRDVLASGSGHLEESHLQTVGERPPRSQIQGAQSLSSFPITPLSLLERVSQLRVRIISAKSLRSKDKQLFAKCIFGDQVRQTDLRKRGDDEVHWDQEVVFSATDMVSHPDKQHLYVDLYQRHTLLSDTRVGSVAINLSNINEQPTAHWFQLRKIKGGESESRGMIQMAVWYQLKSASQQQQQQQQAAIDSKEQRAVAFAGEPRAAPAIPPRPNTMGSASTVDYPHGSVYTSAAGGQQQSRPLESSPHFESLHPVPEHDVSGGQEVDPELERVAVSMMADESVAACSWSEYTVRVLDTLNLERVASALMLDTSAGRVVCYITAPMFRRGYSVLVCDRTHTNLLKSWTNQSVTFALPDQLLASARPQDAVLRFSFYFYASVVSGAAVQTTASVVDSHRLTGGTQMGGIADPSVQPILLGSSTIPLLSIWTQKLESLAGQKQSHPEIAEADEENEIVDVANIDPEARERAKWKRQQERQRTLTAEETAQREWMRKWIPIGTPSQTSEAASMCVRVQRREVKMPLHQAVASSDQLAAYTPTRLHLRLRLPLLGVSIISGLPEEIAYLALENLQVTLRDSATTTNLQLSLDKLQIDNLMHDAVFPVILSAASVKPREWMPVVQLAVTRQKVPGINVQCFEYVSFLLQTLDVRMTELYIYQLLDFVNDLTARVESDDTTIDVDQQQSQLIYRQMSTELMLPPSQVQSLFFRFLHLQPLAINLSFEANPGIRNHYIGGFAVNPLMAALSVLEAGVGSLDSAPIRLNGKIIERHLGSPESVARVLATHYIKEGIKQVYKVFGSLEILGNPVALGASLGAGVKSFFHEPAAGLMVSPEAFGAGLATGSYGLVKNTVAGVGSAVGGIFNSGGKAAAAMSLDQQFITRTSILNAREPDNVGQGIKQGAKSLATGIKEGIKGIVMDPVRGAQQHGAAGLVKGLGTGLLGVVAKPVSGAMTMVSQTAKGIANTGDYLADGPRQHVTHMRAKRYIDPLDPRVTVYSAREAEEAREDRKLDAGDVAREAERQQRHETSSRIIMATVDEQFHKHSNQQMVDSMRKDHAKVDSDDM